ncbi:kinesin-like protein KIF20A [Microcaecilia unicolor]|uniref:Kinesin-like protein n=1 Tax=Microcaecilia unicolor TaxID=1415580 RepID=A0A6P7X741_9AMPH|nr:kinesin-like protein KIF20A [Microcaecilia unicolor]XP_030046010.1 kinesin-like protein KIF20A [Microcaecilia unicolor]
MASCGLEAGAVFESTSCSLLSGRLTLADMLPELSPVLPTSEGEQVSESLKVYLRVRPFSKAELASNESQGCVTIESSEIVALQAPKDSAALKNSEKGIGQSMHKFTFTQIFGSETTQNEFFDGTIKDLLTAFIDGQNALVFTYGVTNAGKTYTIQGSSKDAGILPRSLDLIFNHINGRLYLKNDLKPHLSNDIMKMDFGQVEHEEAIKSALLSTLKEETDHNVKASTNQSSLKDISCLVCPNNVSLVCVAADMQDCEDKMNKDQEVQFSVWMSFFEIYNEYVYDLLKTFPSSKCPKRPALRVYDDQTGNSYVRDLRWMCVNSTEEASKILKIGNKNRSLAFTKMNHQSSRSHSIFSIRLLRVSVEDEPCVLGVSELSLCDLAGSERCNRTQTVGDRLKEAGNINNSLLILGKCIAALKQTQNTKGKHVYIPFRESKLTRLFQPFFCGKGKACMIVNINQCASTYDETLNVMKFSAVAKQVVQTIQPKAFEFWTPKVIGKDGKAINFDANVSIEELLSEENLLEDEDEMDVTTMSHEDALKEVENLRKKLSAERQSKLVQELQIRKEMGEAMFQQMLELEETWSKLCEDEREKSELLLEKRFEMYRNAIKQHAYHCAMEEVEDNYVPVEDFLAEQEKVKERDQRILELEMTLTLQKQSSEARSDLHITEERTSTELKNQKIDGAVEELQKQCREKEELIKSLQAQIKSIKDESDQAISKTNEENTALKQLIILKDQEIQGLQGCVGHIGELQAMVSELQGKQNESGKCSSLVDVKQPKSKRGLFSNFKSTVTRSPKSLKGQGKSEEASTPSRKQSLLRKM